MILSSFNWKTLDYDYYETDLVNEDLGGWDDLQGLGVSYSENSNGVGIDIEDALPDLPRDATYIGSGEEAMGRVVKPAHKLKKIPIRKNYKKQSLKGTDLVTLGNPTSAKKNDDGLPLVFFAVPLIAGLALGYRASAQTLDASAVKKLIGVMAGVAVGVAIGREYESFKSKR